MADTIQNRRGARNTLPQLADGEIGLCTDTEQVFIGGVRRNIPILTLSEDPGKALGIDGAARQGSDNLITSGAVYAAMQTGGGGGGGITFTTDETLILQEGVLRVNTATAVEADNTLPVTSAAVNATVGNIEALLATI